jgi:protein-S-isoprenylcysteine O-methyltransferase Ste14
MFGLFLGAWHIMGYSHSPDMAGATINRQPGMYWWWLAICFTVGLGFRIVGFRWISKSLQDPISALVIASTLGLLLFNLSIQLDGNERYGMYYLDSVFSIFAFSRLTSGWWRGDERARWSADWLKFTGIGIFFLLAYAVLMRVVDRITHSDTWVVYNRIEIVSVVLLGLVVVGVSVVAKRNRRFSMVSSAILMGVLMIGFLAWIAPWLNFGMGRMKMDVTISSGEVLGLKRLGELAARDDRFATNKHDVDSSADKTGRSYAYAAISERPVLLEGYLHHTRRDSPAFEALLHDNDLIFTTTDAETLRSLARTWSVRWLVARPGTDIALPRPLPAWLLQQQSTGDLRIYRID